MKVENNIILSNVFHIVLILLIGFFALQNLNLMLTKLRFVEIADDLNASFLELRISEKNYFLYRSSETLQEMRDQIDNSITLIDSAQNDIVRAIGQTNLDELRKYLRRYSAVFEEVRRSTMRDPRLESMLRTQGKRLREFSAATTKLERRRVNEIIENSKKVLFYSFWAVLLTAVMVSHFVSQKILRSLRLIEKLAKSISQGTYQKIEGTLPADEFGSVINAVNSMSEELKDREEELIQSKKLASLGILTAGVAHELTNPLNNISMIVQNYMEFYDYLNKANSLDLMQKIQGETERIEDIVKNLLDFSKPKEAVLGERDINETVRKALRLMQNTLDISNIDVKLFLQDGLPPVLIDEHQIQQVLVNLILNAVQAMEPGGRLTLASRRGKSGDNVKVDVSDTGKGIPPEFIPHLFDPFFSTKGVGGTGLGLSVSYGIIRNHKGNIKVDSKVGAGTTFTIELPVPEKGKEEIADEQLQDHGNR